LLVRVLVSSTGGAGHLGPLLPFADALADAGHEVLFVVPPELQSSVAGSGHAFELGASPPAEELAPILARLPQLAPDEAAVLGNRDMFGRLWTAAMRPALERTVAEWRPDLVVRDPCEYASAIAAERHRVPHTQVAISLAEVESRSLELAAPVLGDELVSRLRASPYLSRFPAPLDPSPFPDTRRYRDEATPASPLPDWWHGSTDPLVYVTFGTVASRLDVGQRAYAAALAAVRGLPARVLLTSAGATLPKPRPDNVHVEPWVPQSDVLASAALVVCHGGSGTAFGALAAGVPLVLVPMFADQRANAALLARAGAALVSSLDHGAAALRAAIETVLQTPAYRRHAERIRDAAQSAPRPLDALLDLPLPPPARHA
jgi:UDP:flavonoid glycosyltransferase YjiC (YdhE family)